jgi:uncharacterized membrane protein YfcA
MLPKLELGRNYAYLFFVIVGITLFLGLFFSEKLAEVLFSSSFYFLGFLQLYSGIMLDRSWTAKFKKEKNPFRFRLGIFATFLIGTFSFIVVYITK